MKVSNITFVFILLLSAVAVSRAQSLEFRIRGKLQGISPVPSKIYLSELGTLGILVKTKDSAIVKNGEYFFEGKLQADEATGVLLSSNTPGGGQNLTNNIQIIIDKGELDLVSNGYLSNVTVSGSAAAAHRQFEEMRKNVKARADSVNLVASGEAYKTNKDLRDEVQKKSLSIAGQTIWDMYNYVKKNPGARVSPYTTYFLMQLPFLSAAGKDTLLQVMPASVKAGMTGRAVLQIAGRNKAIADSLAGVSAAQRKKELSKVPIGSKAQEITQNDVNGKPVSLSSLKGRYVLIDFWASWCAPCRAENPNIVKAYNTYKDKGFTILGVSLDGNTGKAAWLKAIKSDGLEWTQISELNGWKNSAALAYGVSAIPQNFLVDPNGIIIARDLRGEDLNKKLSEIFKK